MCTFVIVLYLAFTTSPSNSTIDNDVIWIVGEGAEYCDH